MFSNRFGKTLTAFLTVIDELVRKALDGKLQKKVHCVYISPIKALANDIQRNLIGPLTEISENYLPDRAQEIKVGLRTGDTPQSERQKMLKHPPHILITTPESLAIVITSPRFQPIVSELEYMIVDELHSLVPTKGEFISDLPYHILIHCSKHRFRELEFLQLWNHLKRLHSTWFLATIEKVEAKKAMFA